MRVQDERKFKWVGRALMGLLTLTLVDAAWANNVAGQISKIADATHIEFKGLSSWDYDVNKIDGNKIEMLVPAFDEKTEVQLRAWSDELVSKIDIAKDGPDGKYKLTFNLSDGRVEQFDYLTDDPSRLIIDFYRAPVTAQAEGKINTETAAADSKKVAQSKKAASNKNSGKKQADGNYKKLNSERKPASDEILVVDDQGEEKVNASPFPQAGVFDGGDKDYNRFKILDYDIKEEAVIASRQNIYINFPMLKMKTSRLDEILENPPEYVIKPQDTKENKEARLILTLYAKKRFASALKTYDYFIKKYPKSIYDEIIRNVSADTDLQMFKKDGRAGDFESAKKKYTYLINKYPKSVMSERNELIVAYSELERGNGIETIQRFQDFLQKYPDSTDVDQAKNALADGYLILNKYEDALNIYKDLQKNARSNKAIVEATYREGDIYLSQKKYKEAVEKYQTAMSKYPKENFHFPNALYNSAESKFWMGDYKSSLNDYIEFLKINPTHEHGGYAMTRIGELLEILGADQSKVMGAFLESFFRFKNNPGAEVARIRMLSQRMRGMKEKEMKDAIKEMADIAKKSELPKISEFVTLMVADGLHGRGEYTNALDYLIGYYQRYPTSANLPALKQRILVNIADLVETKLKNKDFLSALKIADKYANTWLKNANRIDIPYFVARGYEMAGVFSEAEKMYEKTLAQLEKIAGTQEEKERKVNEHLPSLQAVSLRLAKVAFADRRYKSAYDYLNKTSNTSGLSPSEKVERVELAADLFEERGEKSKAREFLMSLTETWKDDPKLLATTYLRLAKLQFESKNKVAAEKSISQIEKLQREGAILSADVEAETLSLKAEVLLSQGKQVSAVQTYLKALEKFENSRPMASTRYKAGLVLFDRGDVRGAQEIWSRLDSSQSQFYSKLAKEKMSQSEWQQEYDRYIDRIPAASSMKEGK